MFETYAAALLAVVVVFILVYMAQTYRLLRTQMNDSMSQLSANISTRLEDEVRQISNLSERITFSPGVRELFFKKLSQTQDAAEIYRLTNQMNETLYGIIGPKHLFYHMNIIDLSGKRFAFGQEYNYRAISHDTLKQLPWLTQAVEKSGKLVVSPTSESMLTETPAQVISLSRGFGPLIGGTIGGVVEIQIDYSKLAETLVSTAYLDGNITDEKQVIVLDSNGSLIYPLELDRKELAQCRQTKADQNNQYTGFQTIKSALSGKTQHIFFSEENSYGWQVLLMVSDSVMSRPIRQLILQIIFLSVLMLIGTGIFSAQASRVYSEPIGKLYNSVKNLTLEDLTADYKVQMSSGVDELEQLNKVFDKMVIRLHESLDQVIESRNMEMHARMLALQAQMNPHFLYNTLTVISIMADNDEKENVQWACRNLSDMLSYISSDALRLVPLAEELNHTKNYMELIKMRYTDDIEFTLQIPESAESLSIPKLVIQPLVENSVKYATLTAPVWRIQLSAWTEGGKWYVCIQDNGAGFSEAALKNIKDRLRIIRETQKIPELTLNGMGILNIYLRMYFYYKDALTFDMENLPDGGAKILIGGLQATSDTI